MPEEGQEEKPTGISRRKFFRKGVAATAVLTALTGCRQTSPSEATPLPPTATPPPPTPTTEPPKPTETKPTKEFLPRQ